MKRKFWNWVRNEGERNLFLNGEISDETWYIKYQDKMYKKYDIRMYNYSFVCI